MWGGLLTRGRLAIGRPSRARTFLLFLRSSASKRQQPVESLLFTRTPKNFWRTSPPSLAYQVSTPMTAPIGCVNGVIEYAQSSEWTMHPPAGEVTRLLHAWSAGDRTVEDRLFSLVLPELRNLAQYLV